MSSYEIAYASNDPHDPKAQAKAIKDIKKYLGSTSRWEGMLITVTSAVLAGYSMTQIQFLCSIAGIQGYPASALVARICKQLNCDMPKECPDTITPDE